MLINLVKPGVLVSYMTDEMHEFVAVYRGETENSYNFGRVWLMQITNSEAGDYKYVFTEMKLYTETSDRVTNFTIPKNKVIKFNLTHPDTANNMIERFNIISVG